MVGREPNKVRFSNIAKNIAIRQIKLLTIAHYVRNITSMKLFVKLAIKVGDNRDSEIFILYTHPNWIFFKSRASTLYLVKLFP